MKIFQFVVVSFLVLVNWSGLVSAAELQNGVAMAGLNAEMGTRLDFIIEVPVGATNLVIETTAGSDLDLFVRYNDEPTATDYDYKSDGPSGNESVTVSAPQSGTWHIMLYAFSEFANATAGASYQGGGIAPVASASVSRSSVYSGESVTLIGGGTDSDGTVVSYQWQQTDNSGVVAVLSSAGSVTTSFTAPDVNAPVTLSFQLTVTDNDGATGTATASVVVNPVSGNILQNGVTLSGLSAAMGESLYYTLEVPDGATDLVITTTAGSDLDLFVRYNDEPTATDYDYKSDGPSGNESVTASAPQSGTWHIIFYAFSEFTDAMVTASYIASSVDTIPPSVSIGSPANNVVLQGSPTTVTGMASDDVELKRVSWLNSSTGGNGMVSINNSNGSWSASVPLQSGSNEVAVTAEDAAGNKTTAMIVVTYSASVMDTIPPSILISAPANNAVVQNPSVTVTGTASDDVELGQVSWLNSSTGGSGAAVINNNSGSWSASIPLQSGSNTITVTAEDTSDNMASAALTVVYDETSLPPPVTQSGGPVLLFSDLTSGPSTGNADNSCAGGAIVTVWGHNLGESQGSSSISIGGVDVPADCIYTWGNAIGNGVADLYSHHGMQLIAFKVPSSVSPNPMVYDMEVTVDNVVSNALPFRVQSEAESAVYFVSANGSGDGSYVNPMSPYDVYTLMKAGDIFYFFAGTYGDDFDTANWNESNYNLGPSKRGTADRPVAFIGYPGEVAILEAVANSGRSNFDMVDSEGSGGHYVTIAKLTLKGEDACISSGANTTAGGEVAESGAVGMRVVGTICSANYNDNTMTGLFTIGGDSARIYGNEFKDAGTLPTINNNHTIYVQVGSDDVDIGWNYLHDLKMGHLIQVHTDTAFTYENIRIHDNVITNPDNNYSRGITASNMNVGSYGAIYNNVLYNVGQGFSGLSIYNGHWKVYHNTFYNVRSGSGVMWLKRNSPTAEVYNNIFYAEDSGTPCLGVETDDNNPNNRAEWSQYRLSNNVFYNCGVGEWSSSPGAVNADPDFENVGAGRFSLNTGSPAIDSGTANLNSRIDIGGATVEVDADYSQSFDGVLRPQGNDYDIGAYER